MFREVGAIKVKTRDPMPDVSLPSTRGHPISPAEFRGKKNVVLYFFPGPEAPEEFPGCQEEAVAFRDVLTNLRDLDAAVLGVSRAPLDDLREFAADLRLNFPLLSDPEGQLAGALGVPELRGEDRVLAKRVTFVGDSHGLIRQIFPDVKVESHAQEVLRVLAGLQWRR